MDKNFNYIYRLKTPELKKRIQNQQTEPDSIIILKNPKIIIYNYQRITT